jgi:CheY-like chemotaxis protein
VGPASTLDEALALAEAEDFDLAILDVNLHNQLSYPVADRLQQRGIPFIFATAYVHDTLPARFMNAPFIQKPYESEALMKLVEQGFASATAPRG